MVLNVLFLAGGICVGYLIRGEINRRKSNKAVVYALGKTVEFLKEYLDDDKEETESNNDSEIDNIFSGFNMEYDNSSDETIKL